MALRLEIWWWFKKCFQSFYSFLEPDWELGKLMIDLKMFISNRRYIAPPELPLGMSYMKWNWFQDLIKISFIDSELFLWFRTFNLRILRQTWWWFKKCFQSFLFFLGADFWFEEVDDWFEIEENLLLEWVVGGLSAHVAFLGFDDLGAP